MRGIVARAREGILRQVFVDDLSVCGLEGQIYGETGIHIAALVRDVEGNLEATVVTEWI